MIELYTMAPVNWKVLSTRKEDILDVILENRGLKTAEEKEKFLNPTLESVNAKSVDINEKQLELSVKRIKEAFKKDETIIVYGDYDVDGIAGSAILWETLYKTYKNVMPYIPHRESEGYGLSVNGINNILSKNPEVKLIITVDNGIVAHEAVKHAKDKGIDVIITDHHAKEGKNPPAYSIVHTTKLCGAGVAYLLSKEFEEKDENGHLELAALATIADLVPLIGANRAIVKFGLEALRKTKRVGLLALFKEASLDKNKIGVYEVGHMIAPRLNATGRITHALDSLRLLCTKDSARAQTLARHVSTVNQDRQTMTIDSTINANIVVEDVKNKKIIVVSDEEYNQGIIGLVASRLVDEYYKPAIVISKGETVSKGSARSVRGFNIIEFLRTFEYMFVNAGGHPMAAGFTIETSKIEEFRTLISDKADELLNQELLTKTLPIDVEIGFNDISPELIKITKSLEPFGMGNPEPIFMTKKVEVSSASIVGKDGKHVRLILSSDGKMLEGILFGGAEKNIEIGKTLDFAYTVYEDVWNGNSKLKLKIKDLR